MIEKTIIIILCLLIVYLLRARIISIVKRMICKCVPQKYISYFRKRYLKCGVSSGIDSNSNPIFPVLTTEQEKSLNDAIRITFTGDLILLKDMVENGYDSNKGQYCFDSMFEFVREYYKEADFNIGVFEGPVAGEDKGFSTSCFDDGIPIYLNFPKEYAQAVKRAGFDLVSLANNHMLDKGIEGIYHTIDELDEIGLSHVGAYRNEQEKSRITTITIKDKKVAVLAYTFGSNYYDTDFFFEQENRHLTRVIVSPKNKHIKETLKSVKKDFEEVKKSSPDLIVVLPHMGKQFLHAPDEFQKFWCQVFVENGADIILSDHPHAVQPMEWCKRGDEDVLIVHCPGNFINSYTKHDGDASMIVECYLDPKTGKPFASACIPIYAYCKFGREKVENYKGVPIYKIIKDEQEFPELSIFEYNRIKEVYKLITKTALGVDIGIDNLQRKYYKFADVGYVRKKLDVFEQSDESDFSLMGGGCNILIINKLNVQKCCFIGDSLTEGTKNGGYGWFEPMMSLNTENQIFRFAKGSKTTKFFLDNIESILKLDADVYFLAIGCNDIRYRNPKTCAMTEVEYAENLEFISKSIINKHPSATIICISPWESGINDPFCRMSLQDKNELYKKYSLALESMCKNNGFVFVNPNPYINQEVSKRDRRYYMIDHVHCNADQGIRLYSDAVIKELAAKNSNWLLQCN